MSDKAKLWMSFLVWIVLAYIGLLVLRFFYSVNIRQEYADRYTPLESSVVLDLCTRFEIARTEEVCSSRHDVYAVEFGWWVQRIRADGGLETYSDWHDLLEPYEKCLPLFRQPDPENNYFICRYDLQGNMEFYESYYEIWFRENGELRNYFYRSRYGSE